MQIDAFVFRVLQHLFVHTILDVAALCRKRARTAKSL